MAERDNIYIRLLRYRKEYYGGAVTNMSKLGNQLENQKDMAVGNIKETVGKIMNDNEVEFKGKTQSMKAELGNKVDGMKDEALGKVNHLIDKVRTDKKDNK